MVDDDDDGRTPDHGHPISSPCEPNGSGELIKVFLLLNDKTNNLGFRPGPTQTDLYSHRSRLEA